MTDKLNPQETDKALWRYGVISPLLHRNANGLAQAQVLGRLAAQIYLDLSGAETRLSEETIRKWLYRYRAGGLPALADKTRRDKGAHDVPEPLVEAMFKWREDHPRWTLARILDALRSSGAWNGRKPSRSALYRFASASGLGRRRKGGAPEPTRAFQFDLFGQLWMADFMHGPKIRQGKARRRALLHAIIDDSSRYVVAARFFTQENVEVLISEMCRAVACFGVPERFYTDNGPCYSSRHLKVVCARMGIQLVHTPPYRPQGRGKVERFFRTVRDQFLSEENGQCLEQLNAGLDHWLAAYHERPHASLETTPLKKRLQSESACSPLPEVAGIEDLFRMTRSCRVYKDGTIRLRKRIFEVPNCVPGDRVDVYFMPWDLTRVHYGKNMDPAIPLDPAANARRFNHPK